jgi:dipeptidyl aminopeptidase/acylaminoacyl peptidase
MRRVVVALAALLLAVATPAAAQPSLSYTQESVTFLSDGLKLRGLLARPEGAGPFPAYVHVHGSMTATAANGRPWTRLAPGSHLDALARDGFVVLLVARRGHLGSEGTTVTYHVEDRLTGPVTPAAAFFAGLRTDSLDLLAAVEYLRRLPGVDAERVAVGGHSLGGLIAVMAATHEPRIRAVVSLAGGWTWTERGQETSWSYVSTAWRDAAKINGPVLIMWSRNDTMLGPDVGRDLEQRLRKAGRPVSFVLFPPFESNGHYLFNREAGYPIFTPDLVGFLHTTLGAAAR